MYYLILGMDTHSASKSVHVQYMSFSGVNKDICFGHTKPNIIHEYSLFDYLEEYGREMIESKSLDSNYQLVPIRRTIMEEIATWNLGAAEYVTRKARWMKEEFHFDTRVQGMMKFIENHLALYTSPIITLSEDGGYISSRVKWINERSRIEYVGVVKKLEEYAAAKYPLLHFKMDIAG